MNCEVQRLEDNIRYRILIINEEQYVLDMEQSFWKIIFPFLFWMLPSTVYKVEDPFILEQLKKPNKEKKSGSSWIVTLAGLGYFLGIMLAPLMDYFEIPMTPLMNVVLLMLALILVAILYMSMSHQRKQKLESIVSIDRLIKRRLLIRPSSKQIFKWSIAYIFIVLLIVLFIMGYIEYGNIMLLLFASFFLFIYLLPSRITVEEGQNTVRFID